MDVLILVGALAVISLLWCGYFLVNYIYAKKAIEKINKLLIDRVIDIETLLECYEPMNETEKCHSVSQDGLFLCCRKKGHEGVHLNIDSYKIRSVWFDIIDYIPESGFEETQKIQKSWSFNHR